MGVTVYVKANAPVPPERLNLMIPAAISAAYKVFPSGLIEKPYAVGRVPEPDEGVSNVVVWPAPVVTPVPHWFKPTEPVV